MKTESQENQDRSKKAPVYFIVSVNIDDPSMRPIYDRYIEKVKPIVENFGGTYLVRTEKIDQPFPGSWKPDRVIVVRFDSREACDRCFASAEYKSIMGLRTESVKASSVIVEGIRYFQIQLYFQKEFTNWTSHAFSISPKALTVFTIRLHRKNTPRSARC